MIDYEPLEVTKNEFRLLYIKEDSNAAKDAL